MIILFIAIQRANKFLFAKRIEDLTLRYHWTRFSRYTLTVLAIIFVSRIWFQEFSSILAYLGILSAGLAIALQDVLKNFTGWMFIIWRKPFVIGDRIEIGKFAGDVIDIRIFQFSLLEIGNWVKADQSTGRIIHVPNGMIFTEPLYNFFSGFNYIWSEVSVLLTFESNWKKAKTILQKIADSNALHLSEPRKRRITEEIIWESILEQFAKHDDIDFAYPTVRYFSNPDEGKKKTASVRKKRK